MTRPSSDYCVACNRNFITIGKDGLRLEVATFAVEMEAKLRKNDHKTGWRIQPIEALFKLLMLEVEEFRVADEFFPVEDARKELVDIANFALILHDRLGMIRQDENRHKQSTSPHAGTPLDPKGDGSYEGPDGAK